MRYWLAAVAALVALPALAQTGTATLVCTPPTTYTNGQPIGTAVISYKFYHGTVAGTYPDTKTSTTCGTTFTGLAVGQHFFAATAIVNGVESGLSNVASATVQPVPNAPTGLTVTVTITVTPP